MKTNEVWVVIDRNDRRRIQGIFNNETTAKEFAEEANGVVFLRFMHSQIPQETQEVDYIK